MLPPTSAIDLYSRALDAHLTPAQIDTFVSCASNERCPFESPSGSCELLGTSGHDAVDAVSRASIRLVKSRKTAPKGTHSRGVVDHALCYQRISNALNAPRKVDKNVSLCPTTASFCTRQREDVHGHRRALSTSESPSTKGLALRIRAVATFTPLPGPFVAGNVRSPRVARALLARLPSHRRLSTDS